MDPVTTARQMTLTQRWNCAAKLIDSIAKGIVSSDERPCEITYAATHYGKNPHESYQFTLGLLAELIADMSEFRLQERNSPCDPTVSTPEEEAFWNKADEEAAC